MKEMLIYVWPIKRYDILAQLHLVHVPDEFKNDFVKFVSLIDDTVDDAKGLTPVKIKGKYNVSAQKYIELLLQMQEYLELEIENSEHDKNLG